MVHLCSIMIKTLDVFNMQKSKIYTIKLLCSDLYTYTTADAQCLWDSGDLISRCNFNTQLPCEVSTAYTVNCAFLFRAHHVAYPFWRPDTTSCTPGDISWACIYPGSRWLFEWASLAPPLLRSTVCTTVVQSRHVRANIPRRCISRDRQFPAKEPIYDRDRSCAR